MPMSLMLSSAGSDDMFCFVAVNRKTCNGNQHREKGNAFKWNRRGGSGLRRGRGRSQRRLNQTQLAGLRAAPVSIILGCGTSPAVGESVDQVRSMGMGHFATAGAASSGRWPPEAPSLKAAASVDKISGMLTAVFDSKAESGV